jgi:hypothetical protein
MGVRYDDPLFWDRHKSSQEQSRWENFFYENDSSSVLSSPSGRTAHSSAPKFLYEQQKVFSCLSRNQFFHCLLIASLNFTGVIWFSQALEVGGILEQSLGGFGRALKAGLIPVLWFYAKLFFFIPFFRFLYILLWNKRCHQRNESRKQLAQSLGAL